MIYGRAVTRARYGLAIGSGRLQPRFFGSQDLSKRCFGGRTMSGAVLEIRDIGDVSAVFLRPENVDVIVPHVSPPEAIRVLQRAVRVGVFDTASLDRFPAAG